MVKRYRNSPSDHSVVDRQRGVAAAGRRWPSRAQRSPPPWCGAATNSTPRAWFPPPSTATNEKGVSDALDIIGFNYNLKSRRRLSQAASQAPGLWIGDGERHFNARRLRDRPAAQHCERLRRESHELGRDGRGVVDVLRHARVAGRRLCLDRLRLSRRAHALRMALDQLAIRHRGHVRISQGHFLLLQGVVERRAVRCTCFRTGTWRAGKARRFRFGSTRISTKSSCSSTARAWAARRFRIWATWSGRCATSRARSRRAAIEGRQSCVLTEKRETTGPAVAIRLTADRSRSTPTARM